MSRYNRFIVSRPTMQCAIVLPCLIASIATGCVRRTITISSDPSGALCWLNGREVGRTPVKVDFLHYGTYDVVLEAEGCEPLLTSGRANPPWWDIVPLDLFAEMVSGEPHADIAWHYELAPLNNDPTLLVERARELRQYQAETSPPPEVPASAPATQPATAPAPSTP